MTISENLKRIRKEQGLTQKKLGELCEMSEAMIRQYELGYRKPKFKTLLKIAKALECEVTDIDESIMTFFDPERIRREEQKIAEAKEIIKRRDSSESITKEEQQKISDYIEYKKDNSSAQNNIIEQNPDNIPRRYSDVIKIKYELTPEKLERIRLDEEAEGIIKKQASGQKITDEERQKVSDYIERREKSYAKLRETPKKLGKIVNESFKPSIESYDSILQALNNIAASIFNSYKKLNDVGQQKVIDYIEDLSNIPEYRKEPPQEEPPSPQTPPDTPPEPPQDEPPTE